MTKKFRLKGLDCANCAAKMENKISKIKGVNSVNINFMTMKMSIDIEDSKSDEILESVVTAINKIDSKVVVKSA